MNRHRLLAVAGAFALMAGAPASAQMLTVPDCSGFTVPYILQGCLDMQLRVIQSNRSFCLSRIDTARRREAAGVRNAWQQVPTECLY